METTGQVPRVVPPPITNHTSTVYGDKMYLFGGSTMECENQMLYSLDLNKYQWQLIKPKAAQNNESNFPITREEHTCVVYNDSMVIFGGFAFGERTNSMFKYNFKQNTWEMIKSKNQPPCERAGHSAVIRMDDNGDHMYIFGGKDNDNQKINDTWKFNMTTHEWHQIDVPADEAPQGRSGHASQNYKDFMIVYGGIFEVTKELNDMHVFDMKNERWLCLF